MIKIGYNKKSLLLIGFAVFLVVSLAVTVILVLSERSLDERTSAVSEIGVDLNPNSGTISEAGLNIDLIVNTHGESISGVDVTLQYSGEIAYDGFSQGKINNCSVTEVRQGIDKVNLHCFIDPSQPTHQGSNDVFATVNFRATGVGSARINITEVFFSVRTAVGEVSFLGGSGEYVTSFSDGKIAMELDPDSGNISQGGLDIDLIIDTQDENIGGVDATLEYTGEIEYVSFAQGEIENCLVVATKQEGQKLSLHCFIDATKPTYKGRGDVFATVKFKSTADGESKIEITKVDFAVRDNRNEITFLGGIGNYVNVSKSEPPICGSLNMQTFPYETQSWPSDSFCSKGISDPIQPIFPSSGSSTKWICLMPDESSVACSASRQSPPPPSCGTLNGQTFKYEVQSWPSGTLCSVGNPNPTNPEFPSAGSSAIWECIGIDSSRVSCSSQKDSAPPKAEPLPDTSLFDFVEILGGTTLLFVSGIVFMYKGSPREGKIAMRKKLFL